MTEIGLGSNNSVAEGSVLPLYDGATQTDRIKYDQAAQTTARYWWLRSPYPWYARDVRIVLPSGALGSFGSATYGYGCTGLFEATDKGQVYHRGHTIGGVDAEMVQG